MGGEKPIGETVDEGTLVTVTLSTPDNQVKVPNLIGMTVTSAEITTDNLGLCLDGANDGVIVDQAPAAGTMVDPDATVYVTTDVDEQVEVPNFVGMAAEDAEQLAENVGLSLDGDADGTIVDQAPQPGTMLNIGDTVSIKTSN